MKSSSSDRFLFGEIYDYYVMLFIVLYFFMTNIVMIFSILTILLNYWWNYSHKVVLKKYFKNNQIAS